MKCRIARNSPPTPPSRSSAGVTSPIGGRARSCRISRIRIGRGSPWIRFWSGLRSWRVGRDRKIWSDETRVFILKSLPIVPRSAIRKQLECTKSALAGEISRIRKAGITLATNGIDLVVPPSPVWHTPEINGVITTSRAEGVSVSGVAKLISDRFGLKVTKGMMSHRCSMLNIRTLAAPILVKSQPEVTSIDGPVPVWRSREADELLALDVGRRCKQRNIAARFGITLSALERRCRRLKLKSGVPVILPEPEIVVPTRDAIKARRWRARKAGLPYEGPEIVKLAACPTNVTQRAKDPAGRGASTITSVYGWSMSTLPKPAPRADDICRWPSCDDAGNPYCDHHAGLLRKQHVA